MLLCFPESKGRGRFSLCGEKVGFFPGISENFDCVFRLRPEFLGVFMEFTLLASFPLILLFLGGWGSLMRIVQFSRCSVFGNFWFWCFRNTQPRFQFIVMNRRNTGYSLYLVTFS